MVIRMAEFDTEFITDDEQPDFISLTDQEGNEDEFVVIGCVQWEGQYYVLTMPVDAGEEDEELVFVFGVRQEGEEEYFEYIADEDVVTAVFERYDQLYRELEQDA